MKTIKRISAIALLAAGITQFAVSQTTVQVDVKKQGTPIQSTMYGIFFEDINYGADGGLYAELIKNRSFDFPQSLQGWKTFGKVTLQKDGPFSNNPNYIRLLDPGHKEKYTGIDNEGFLGIPAKENESYRFSVWGRTSGSNAVESIKVELVNHNSEIIASTDLSVDSKDWKKYQVVLTPKKTDAKAFLRIFFNSRGSLDLDHVSLFPVDTWKNRENGLRKDLAQALYDLKPGVFRFPGGCIVEGTDLNTRYQWKNTVGPVENRKLNENRWQYTFPHRFFPDYYQTYGLGFFEFFQLSEDIGSEPLPIISVGLSCQFQNACCEAHVPVDGLKDYIQDAVDLVEFANGDITTQWGKLRADMGHPAPFNLKMMGIGNEQWGPEYPERLAEFLKVMRVKCPNIKIVGSSGPFSDGKDFDLNWPKMRELKVDLVDEHYYKSPGWFISQAGRYDNYDRKGPKVFAGEYACHTKSSKNSFEAALMEAAFMTGLERNADVVQMATYAPLFAHVEAWQWRPDLIWFDNLKSVRSVNYYVQQLYGKYKGTNVLKTTADNKPLEGQNGLFASTAIDNKSGQIILKVANTSDQPQIVKYAFNGLKPAERKALQIVLHSDNQDIENTIDQPNNVVPVENEISIAGNTFDITLAPKTFNVIVFNK